MDVVVGAEWYDLQIWSNVVHYASSHAVHVESVEVHESHAAEEEDSAAQIGERIVRWGDVHFKDGFHECEDSDFFGD